jgi:hypothetical protein
MSDLSAQALVSLEEARRYVFRDENDGSRDDLLIDAVNDVSDSIWDYCEREFLLTTSPERSGTDGVTNGTTTFVAATGAFTVADVGSLLNIATKGFYRIVTFTNVTTVVLDGSPTAGTALAWNFGEARVFSLGQRGLIDLNPYELRQLDSVVLYTDQPGSEQTLTSDEYRLRRSKADTYLAIRVPAPTISEAFAGFGWEATVTGEWGMAAVPDSVAFACKQWVKNIAENPGSYASHSMSGYVVTPELEIGTAVMAGMPPAVRHRLSRWKRGADVG